MSNERIIPDNKSKLIRTFGVGGMLPRWLSSFTWSSWLGWRQWLVLFSIGAAVILIEVRNHSLMWQEHKSGQTLWTDHMLVWEIILFGLVLPILGGVVLGYVGRTAVERDKIARELELRRVLVARIHEAQTWNELAELLVTTPGSIVSADQAWLLAQRTGEEEFEQIAHWQDPTSELRLSARQVSAAVCERCVKSASNRHTRILTCHREDPGRIGFSPARYCLWLSSGGMGKTALLFDMPINHPLGDDQMKVMDDLGGEMTLAIDNANLHYVKQRHGDAAKNERLRIARNIHDTLGQNVSYLRMKLEQLNSAQLAYGRTEFQDELVKMLVVADEVYEQVRDTLEELRTTDHRDLEESVRLYAAQAAERGGFSVEIHSSGLPSTLSSRKSRQMMYIIREALNNVEKHASAENVEIHLQWRSREFILTIRDDGKGFQPETVESEDSYGMAIMGERSRAINAELTVESAVGQGTELKLNLPISSSVIPLLRSQ